MYTSCVAELNQRLSRRQMVDETSFLTFLSLFRIANLLVDWKTARMHYEALKRLSTLSRRGRSLVQERAGSCEGQHHQCIPFQIIHGSLPAEQPSTLCVPLVSSLQDRPDVN